MNYLSVVTILSLIVLWKAVQARKGGKYVLNNPVQKASGTKIYKIFIGIYRFYERSRPGCCCFFRVQIRIDNTGPLQTTTCLFVPAEHSSLVTREVILTDCTPHSLRTTNGVANIKFKNLHLQCFGSIFIESGSGQKSESGSKLFLTTAWN